MLGLMSEPPSAVTQQRQDHVGLLAEGRDERRPGGEAREADQEVAEREDGEADEEAAPEAVAVDDGAGQDGQQIEQRVEELPTSQPAASGPRPTVSAT